jgi:hypothetical protein
MNKQISLKKILSVILVFMMVLGFSLSSIKPGYAAPTKDEDKKIKISVDPRIELLTVVQYMVFGTWRMSKFDTNYAAEVEETFGPFYRHPVLNQYWYMWYYFDFVNNVPFDLMLRLSNPPELTVKTPIPKELTRRAGGEKNLNDFLVFLRDFAEKTNFMDFYEDHKALYKTHIDKVTKQIEKEDYVGLLEGYYGPSPNSYSLILAILLYEGGYGVNVGGIMYAIIGPCNAEDKEPVFDEPNYLFSTTIHQFGYSFVSPLTSKILEDVKRCQKLMQPIQTEMENMLYPLSPTWEICMNEHLIRAITLRILVKKYGEEETKKKIKEEYNNYFVYIEYVLGMLDEYEKNRDLYPNFSDFFPKIQAMFEELCEYPLIPTFLKTDYSSQNGVQISWNDNSVDEIGFMIYRKEIGDQDYVKIGEAPANQISLPYYNTVNFRDNKVTIGKTYVYVISTVGEKGEIYSNSTEVTISAIKPVSIKKLEVNYNKEKTKLTFSWFYPFYCEGFKIYEISDKRVLVGEIPADKSGEFEIDIPSAGKHTYVITAWIKGEKDTILESFDSKICSIEIE